MTFGKYLGDLPPTLIYRDAEFEMVDITMTKKSAVKVGDKLEKQGKRVHIVETSFVLSPFKNWGVYTPTGRRLKSG